MAAIIFAAVVLLAAGIGYWLWARQYEWTDDAFVDGHVVQMAPEDFRLCVGNAHPGQ